MNKTTLSKRYDIGERHVIRFILRDGVRVGVAIDHPRKRRGQDDCSMNVSFDTDTETQGPKFHVEQMNPLTLSPVLLCLDCSDCGYVKGGRWIPASGKGE